MKKLRYAIYIIIGLQCNMALQAQVAATLSIQNEKVEGSNYQFDLYIKANKDSVLYLTHSDFVLSFNAAHFSTPKISKVAGSCELMPIDRNNLTILTKMQNTYLEQILLNPINTNQLVLNLIGPTPGNEESFRQIVAKVDHLKAYRIGRFRISGYNGLDAQLQLKLDGNKNYTMVFGFEPSYPFKAKLLPIAVEDMVVIKD